jgi:hypothetical protein
LLDAVDICALHLQAKRTLDAVSSISRRFSTGMVHVFESPETGAFRPLAESGRRTSSIPATVPSVST